MRHKKIGPVIATAMSVTVIVGAGLMVLPGLTFAQAGKLGYLPWIFVALLMIPLLEVFSFFGKNFPSAGGVVGYVRASLGGRLATVAETIIIGTFTLGIPAIALIGSSYLQQSIPQISAATAAILALSTAFLLGMAGLRISGSVQTGIAVAIVAGLLAVGIGFISSAGHANTERISLINLSGVFPAIPLVLFAFTGWEMTAFLAEDMENPERDLPISIWASFVIISLLYVFIAWTVASYGSGDLAWKNTPVTKMFELWLGSLGGRLTSFIAALLVMANVIAAFISAFRGIYSAGRDGLLPRILGRLNGRDEPACAMIFTYGIFLTVAVVSGYGIVSVGTLLKVAGQNFFVLYLLACVGYMKLHRGSPQVCDRSCGFSVCARNGSVIQPYWHYLLRDSCLCRIFSEHQAGVVVAT